MSKTSRRARGAWVTGPAIRLVAVLAAAGAMLAGPTAVTRADTSPVEGASFPGLTVSAPAGCPGYPPAPMIDWGDNQPESQGQCASDGLHVITGPHTYDEEGSYSAVAHYTSSNGARTSAFSVQVADAALTASSAGFAATAGRPFTGVVANLGDANPGATASDYSAAISWGDGTSSAGSAQAAGSGFAVSGAHTYAAAGHFPVSIVITDSGGASTTASGFATVAASPPATPPPTAGSQPVRASFTMPATAAAGQTVTLDASSSHHGSASIRNLRWTVNGRQLANCAGATSRLMTRTLPAGADSIGLTLVGGSGPLAATTQRIVVRGTAHSAHAISARAAAGVRVIKLPPEATCSLSPGDPPSGRVAPGVAYAPSLACRTQVQSGVVDAVGCLTEFKDTIEVKFVPHARGHLGSQGVSLPAGQTGLDGVGSADDTKWLLQDVQNALNPTQPRTCVDSNGNDYICSTVGEEQQPAGPSFNGGPELGGVETGQAVTAQTSAAALSLSGDACAAKPSRKSEGEAECLDLWVSSSPVRINGVDYAPPPGGEIVIAPQFNLLVSQKASTSLDGLLLHSSDPFQQVNFELPPSTTAGGDSAGIDYPALSVPDLPAEIAKQRGTPAAAAISAELSAVGGFPSVGGLKISFDDDTATITFEVQLPPPFDGGDGAPVTAAVTARIGPTEPFHIVYGYLGNDSGGSAVDLGPVALSGFGICFRAQYSSDTTVDPCRQITNIDDAGPDNLWTASANLNIADALDVEFRPGSNTIPGCSQAIPLGFAFGSGGLSRAGAALDLKGSGGVPIFPGVSITGLAAGFSSGANYEVYGGCVGLSVVDLLSITGNVFGVHTVNGYRYNFAGDELGPGVLQRTGGTYPYTDHVGIGASGVASLTLPELPAFQVGDAYALYVDDPAAVFFGAGLDLGLPHGNYEDQPGTGIAFKGGLKGAIGLARGFPFDFEGYANFEANALSQRLLSGEAELIVSYSPQAGRHGGVGACVGLSIGNASGSAGFAYHWGDTYFDLPGDINIGSCDNNWLDRQIGVNVQAAAATPAGPSAGIAALVPSGLDAVNLRVHAAVGAPDITVTAPGGASASTAGLPLNQIAQRGAFKLVRYPTLHETIIAPDHPRAGRYRITINSGSPAITKITRLDGYRPRISAQVAGHGIHRRLLYRFTRRAGQRVDFFEISGQVHRSLGSTTGGHGAIAFTATPGHGRRQIVGEVYGNGVPRVRVTVTSYHAPGMVRLGRVGHLRVRRSRGRATASFGGVSGAKAYRVNLKLNDGTRRVATTRGRRASFGPIFIDSAGTITVQALGDGLRTISGATVRHRLAPLFGRGRPARRRRRG